LAIFAVSLTPGMPMDDLYYPEFEEPALTDVPTGGGSSCGGGAAHSAGSKFGGYTGCGRGWNFS